MSSIDRVIPRQTTIPNRPSILWLRVHFAEQNRCLNCKQSPTGKRRKVEFEAWFRRNLSSYTFTNQNPRTSGSQNHNFSGQLPPDRTRISRLFLKLSATRMLSVIYPLCSQCPVPANWDGRFQPMRRTGLIWNSPFGEVTHD